MTGALASSFAGISLNQGSILHATTAEFLDASTSAGFDGVSIWRQKLPVEQVDEVRRRADDLGLRIISVCKGGDFTSRDPATTLADNIEAIDVAARLDSPVLVIVSGGIVGNFASAERAIVAGLERLLPHAEAAGVTLAVEPFHPMLVAERSALVTLEQTRRVLGRLRSPNLGIALDVYHVWWDPSLRRELERVAPHIAAVHISDWLVPTRSLLRGRGRPGDGVIDLRGFMDSLRAIGYDGYVEVEVLNSDLAVERPRDLAADLMDRMRRLLGVEEA